MPSQTEVLLELTIRELADARREASATLDRIVAATYDRPEPLARAAAKKDVAPFAAEATSSDPEDDAKWMEAVNG